MLAVALAPSRLVSSWLGDAWASAALYVAVLAVLSLRPQGLFGEPVGRRA